MRIFTVLRRALSRRGQSASRTRTVEDQRAIETARAWERPGGPIDPGFVA